MKYRPPDEPGGHGSLVDAERHISPQPVQTIYKHVREYVGAFLNSADESTYGHIGNPARNVIGLRLPEKLRDEIRQVVWAEGCQRLTSGPRGFGRSTIKIS